MLFERFGAGYSERRRLGNLVRSDAGRFIGNFWPALCEGRLGLLLAARIMMPLAWGFEPSRGAIPGKMLGERVSAAVKNWGLLL